MRRVIHAAKGPVNCPRRDIRVTRPVTAQCDHQRLDPRNVKLVEGLYKSDGASVGRFTALYPVPKYGELSAWSMKPHGPPFRAKAKIGRGNIPDATILRHE